MFAAMGIGYFFLVQAWGFEPIQQSDQNSFSTFSDYLPLKSQL